MELDKVIQKCLQGDHGAWEMLVNTFSGRVFNLAYRFSGSCQEAEDMTQEIFFKLFHSLHRYDIGKNFVAWLTALAKNYLIDEYRRTRQEKTRRDEYDDRLLVQNAFDSPENSLIQEHNKRIVWESLQDLSPEIRLTVILRDIQERTYEEIAESLNLPIGTVKSRVNRGHLQLARIIKERKGDQR